MHVILSIFGLAIFLGFTAFAIHSWREVERRAAVISIAAAVILSTPYLASVLLPHGWQYLLLIFTMLLILLAFILLIFDRSTSDRLPDAPCSRVDERDNMFSRYDLKTGSREYEMYYQIRPENEKTDASIRALPGLMSRASKEASLLPFSTASASFSLTEAVQESVDGSRASTKQLIDPDEIITYLKGMAAYLGAQSVGATKLRDYHVYSVSGRGTDPYGEAIPLVHDFAIAVTVEMDYRMMGTAPEAPVVMESARQYVNAGMIALQLAFFIRSLGYGARAHIDGNYQVIAPLVARDAGLGEIGRMGLLMTPELGPRVRIAVVTTDLPLQPDQRQDGSSVIDFCGICEKCAENCPSRAIPFGERKRQDGAYRWIIDPVKCFRYWNVIGTDCGVCMKVCPYSHPDTFFHKAVRQAVERSRTLGRAAKTLDDLFYGRTPAHRPPPEWLGKAIQPHS
jgi:reductive dehalogenase